MTHQRNFKLQYIASKYIHASNYYFRLYNVTYNSSGTKPAYKCFYCAIGKVLYQYVSKAVCEITKNTLIDIWPPSPAPWPAPYPGRGVENSDRQLFPGAQPESWGGAFQLTRVSTN